MIDYINSVPGLKTGSKYVYDPIYGRGHSGLLVLVRVARARTLAIYSCCWTMSRLRLNQVLEEISCMEEFTVKSTIVKGHLENLEELRAVSGPVAIRLEELSVFYN